MRASGSVFTRWAVAISAIACSGAGGCSESTSAGAKAGDASVDGAYSGFAPRRDAGSLSTYADGAGAGDASDNDAEIDGADPLAGWNYYPVLDPTCQLYVPSSTAQLPPPIQWQPCSDVIPSGVACREMQYDWQAPQSGHIDPASIAAVQPDGGVALSISRFFNSGLIYRTVADADGPVRSAILELPSTTLCTLGSDTSLRESRIAYTALATPVPSQQSQAWSAGIGGSIDDLTPRVFQQDKDFVSRQYVAGNMAFLEWGPGLPLFSWTDGTEFDSLSNPEAGATVAGSPAEFLFSGNALFFAVYSEIYRVAVYTQAGGIAELIAAGGDTTRSSFDLGTDGHDLVWAEGTQASSQFSNVAWMTSPFTTSEAAVQRRQLRIESPPYCTGTSFVVGCGYAAQCAYGSEGPQVGVRLVRLSDGQSWPLLTQNGVDPWIWSEPIAITCSELFVRVETPGDFNVARVRIDSLGPGEPPQQDAGND
jgi:hypothetical protein